MARNIRLSDAIDEFLASRSARGLSPNTVRGDKVSLNALLKSVGNINTKAIEPRHIDMMLLDHAENTASSRNMLITRLRVFFRWAQARNYVVRDPTVEHRRMTQDIDTRLFVPVEDFPVLLDAADNPRDRIVVALGIYLFLRVSEIETLRIGDLDLDAGVLRVKIHKTKDFDPMPICEELDEELRSWLTWYASSIDVPLAPDMYLVPAKRDFRAAPGPNGRFVVTDKPVVKVNPYRHVRQPWTIVQRSLAGAGYPTKGEGGHTLRRSGARAFFDTIRGTEGVDGALQQVKVMLHHKNVSMTEHYLGIAPERVHRDARLKGKPMFRRRGTMPANVLELRR